ncbi:MAG: hypothetical protein B5766_10810 [Candidatus Lumbricidophila eiseniae]|uniref:Solute-binding protein family 5 domain-containing protein n=1 Tax=Candidatus Lumbricidiphila eiseniae TaxID=1969409 RepID=A0A2A6FNR6_9MICO|nr:MAG: hypothetical protein B5766_10810 [Candidatus Lumbricidophila eiseniae]
MKKKKVAAASIALVTAIAIAGCANGASTDAAAKTLVFDTTFDLKTSDPGRAFELTGQTIDKAIYETALTFDKGDLTKPVPQLTTYKLSDDQKTLTLTLTGTHTFSSGNPVTIDDIVFSYQRLQAIAGNPSFLLTNLSTNTPFTITKTSDTTLTITTDTPYPALPYILANPSLGVLDSKTLQKHGGTNTKDDASETYLNTTSAGSGPYQIESLDVKTKVVLTANPKYAGTKPAYSRVVFQNVLSPSQKTDIQGGQAQLSVGLNSQQVAGLASDTIKVLTSTSPNVGYLWLNQDPAYSGGITNNPQFTAAVRTGIDYSGVLAVAGNGAIQPGGIIPTQFLGAIKPDATNTFDLAAAKQSLAASGYSGQTLQISYPTDFTLDGVEFGTLAQKIQAQLQAVGIKVELAGLPITTLLQNFRAGKVQAGLMYWGPDFPDPSDYTTFSPGNPVGLRAGWTADQSPAVTAARKAAEAAVGDARAAAYETWQREANKAGVFIALLQAPRNYVTTGGISNVIPNAVWTVDVALIK